MSPDELPIIFSVQWEQIDEQLLQAALRKQHVGTLEEAEARDNLGAALLEEIAPAQGRAPAHFGKKTGVFWWYIYDLFVSGGAVLHPHGFAAKSVLAADVYEPPIGWAGTAYISVWAEGRGAVEGKPILVPFPHVPAVLMDRGAAGSFADSASAYRMLVVETVARVNLVAPAALMLSAASEADD